MEQVRLSVERFWVERGNYELWPEVLSRLPEKMEAGSAREVNERYLKRLSAKEGRLDKAQEIYGLMGLHINREGVPTINGVGFIHSEGRRLALSKEALEVVQLYRDGKNWTAALARQLVRYSPRCRVLLYLLWRGAVFVSKGQFPNKLARARLLFDDKEYLPFNHKEDFPGLNQLLQDYKEEALGPYWKKKIADAGISLKPEWCFSGVNGSLPAVVNISFRMAPSLDLFHYLGWFTAGPSDEVRLNMEKVKEDLKGEIVFAEEVQDKFISLADFKALIEEYRDYRGYFPVEPVMEKLLARHPDWEGSKERFADYFLTQGVKNGDFFISDHHSGQPRHGRGYLGKRDYQLIKIFFSE